MRGDLRVSKRSSKGVKRQLRQVQRCFEEVSKKVLVCFKTIWKKASRVFQECFNEVLFDTFFVAWISSQLPEQKEGLFYLNPSLSHMLRQHAA